MDKYKIYKKRKRRFESFLLVLLAGALLYIFLLRDLIDNKKFEEKSVTTQAIIVNERYVKGEIYLFKYVVKGEIFQTWKRYVKNKGLEIGQIYLLKYVSDEPTLTELVVDENNNIIQVFGAPIDTFQLDTLKKYGLYPVKP